MKKIKAYQDSEVLDELVTRILCDTQPIGGRADVVYLFGQTKDNEASVMAAAEVLWALNRVKYVSTSAEGRGHGYPGFDVWKKKLIKRGIPGRRIVGISNSSQFPPSTDAEAVSLVRVARARGWKNVYISAPPIHQLRAFISTVSALSHAKTKLNIFNFVGLPQRYEDHIVHSQGIQKGSRSSLIRKELEKIEHYSEKGDLLSPEEVLAYLNKRDS
jgi:hypothetical protein